MKERKLNFLRICLLLALLVPFGETLKAENDYELGGVSTTNPPQLKINIKKDGYYIIYRYINGVWSKQFFDEHFSPIFSIKIRNELFSSGTQWANYAVTSGTTLVFADESFYASGTISEVTKRYVGTYFNMPFSVAIKFTYDASAPEYLIKTATIDASNIPAGTPISLAYGFDTYVNLNDAGYAYTVPDIFYLNNNASEQVRYLTTDQVRSLRLAGAKNNTGGGSLIGFFAMGRSFDGAYSAYPYQGGYCFNVIKATPGTSADSKDYSHYKFQFGPFGGPFYSDKQDNGLGVCYNNIPAGTITELKTGLSFSATLDGELDYAWNGLKDCTANVGDTVNLDLSYISYSETDISDIAFNVHFPGLSIASPNCAYQGFSAATMVCDAGKDYYKITNASIKALGTASMTIPLLIKHVGQWQLDATSISDMKKTLPLGKQAVLTVKSVVNMSSNAAVSLCHGFSHTFTVEYPTGVYADQDVDIAIVYSGNTASFAAGPQKITIPAYQSSATFTIQALATASNRSPMTIKLASSNYALVGIGAVDAVQIALSPLTTPSVTLSANPGFAVCEATTQSIILKANPVNGGISPNYVWTVDNAQVKSGASDSLQINNLPMHRRSEVTCTMKPSADACPTSTSVTGSETKKLRISSCVVPVNLHQRGKIN